MPTLPIGYLVEVYAQARLGVPEDGFSKAPGAHSPRLRPLPTHPRTYLLVYTLATPHAAAWHKPAHVLGQVCGQRQERTHGFAQCPWSGSHMADSYGGACAPTPWRAPCMRARASTKIALVCLLGGSGPALRQHWFEKGGYLHARLPTCFVHTSLHHHPWAWVASVLRALVKLSL